MSISKERKLGIWERRVLRRIPEAAGYGLIQLAETIRSIYVNPQLNPARALLYPQDQEILSRLQPLADPFSNIHPDHYYLLQHSRGIYDGFTMSFILNNTADLLDLIQSKITRRRLPANLKLTGSSFLGFSASLALEYQIGLGVTDNIPSALVGSLAYIGARYLGNRVVAIAEADQQRNIS